ncbi:MAG: ethanolamine ammonia-lyase subunit EutB [Deltaproteobacteria bacterium]|jgi:ethanolamine ammonia-lyase large subunit|nr:ethanolamine ammonia-lyase subunit EutB [Deltaproteobacteria bacterium]
MTKKRPLKELMALASPPRSGDFLAGIAAPTERERALAQMELADVPLERFLEEPLIPYEDDEVTRLIIDTHDRGAFAEIKGLTVGALRDRMLSDEADAAFFGRVAPGITPEMAAACSKIMRAADLAAASAKVSVVTGFRDTLGLPGRFSSRIQPNHPTDDPAGIMAAAVEGLLYASGDAVIGVNPVSGSLANLSRILNALAELIERHSIPTQSCVLTHVTDTLELIRRGAPVDLCFQSVAGSEKANRGFGIDLALLEEAREATLSLGRAPLGDGTVMYFETGQGSALSSDAAFGVDQQTMEARAYAVCRRFRPFIVNTVLGFMGPEYLANGKEIVRAGLEDHFCGKVLGLPMGADVCYTNHIRADQDDMDVLLCMLAAGGITYVMGLPGADDVMLNYQSTSYHDVCWVRKLLGRRPAPEFEAWLESFGITDSEGGLLPEAVGERPMGLLMGGI